MLKYTIKRIIMVIPVVLGVMAIVFFFQAISPDDPVDQLLGSDVTEEIKEAKREELGLNDPILVQFGRYVWNFVTKFDLGTSYASGNPVTQELMNRFPVTVKLAFGAVFLGMLLGIPLGVISAVKQYTAADSGILAFSVLAASMPNFWLGLLLISFFSVNLGWLPSVGITGPKSWVMPIIVVMMSAMSNLIRTTRSSMLESIRQDFVSTARSKGISEYKVVVKHALRNSLIPIISAVGNSLGVQLGGALIVESVFGMPGIGKYAVDAINARNYPAVLGSVVILAITFTIVNLAMDLVYTVVDPRLKTVLFASKKRKAHKKGAVSNA